jgi:hypothetical protein
VVCLQLVGTDRKTRRERIGIVRALRLAAARPLVVGIAIAVLALVVLSPRPSGAGQRQRAILAASPYRPLTSILGVLRHPQTATDLPSWLSRELRRELHNRIAVGVFGSPGVSRVRLATVAPWGQGIYLIPYLPPTRSQIAWLPPRLRNVTRPNSIAVAITPEATGQGTPADIEAGRDIARNGKPDQFVMVLPERVTKVAIWNAVSIAAHPHPLTRAGSEPVVVSVHNNIATFRSAHFRSPGRELWYGPSGNVIKRIPNASSCAPPLGACA